MGGKCSSLLRLGCAALSIILAVTIMFIMISVITTEILASCFKLGFGFVLILKVIEMSKFAADSCIYYPPRITRHTSHITRHTSHGPYYMLNERLRVDVASGR